jgi:hypothetical protein
MENSKSKDVVTPAAVGSKKYQPIYTEDKALRLFRTYTALVSMSLLICWSQLVILQPLEDKAKEMVRIW